MSLLYPPQGGLATIIGDRIVIDTVDLDWPNTLGANNTALTVIDNGTGQIGWVAVAAGAPETAQYLTLAADATLTVERVFTPSTGLTAVDSGAGAAYTLTADLSTGVAGGGTVVGGTAAGDDLSLSSTSNGTKGSIFISDGSKLGIGSTVPTPTEFLHIEDNNANDRTTILLKNTTSGAGSTALFQIQSNVALAFFELASTAKTGSFGGQAIGDSVRFSMSTGSKLLIGNSGAAPIHFITNDITAMTVDSSQNVGIGLTGPATKFHVLGDVRVEDGVLSLFANVNTGATARSIEFRALDSDDNNQIFGNIDLIFTDQTSGSEDGRFVFSHHVAGVSTTFMKTLPGSGAEVNFPGNVSIGSGSPIPSASLDVSGAIAIGDGITAPSATAGRAKLYVDTADGDLKIIFGDGTVKTIVVDT